MLIKFAFYSKLARIIFIPEDKTQKQSLYRYRDTYLGT